MIVDIYTHIFPDRFFQELERGSPKLGNMGKRLRGVPKLFDLDLRFRDMDEIGDYRQIISLPNPPIEDVAEGAVANNLAKVANDSMAELCAKHPDRFPGFAAAVSMHDVDFSIDEAEPLSSDVSITTLAPAARQACACAVCFDGSLSALLIDAVTPALANAFLSSGASNCTQRTDDCVSGSKTQT